MTRLTAEQLEITKAEYDALIWVRDALDPSIPDHDLPVWMQFDMQGWGSGLSVDDPLSCGTNCCIGGSMELHMAGLTQLSPDHVVTRKDHDAASGALYRLTSHAYGSRALYSLFFDYHGTHNDRASAVMAIDRFLAGNTRNPWRDEPED